MNVRVVGSHEGGLRDEQKNPAGEGGAVNVNDESGKRRAKNSREVIGASEAEKNRDEHEDRHAREKQVLVMEIGNASRRLGRARRAGRDGCHFFSNCDVLWKNVPSIQELRRIVKCRAMRCNRVVSIGTRREET